MDQEAPCRLLQLVMEVNRMLMQQIDAHLQPAGITHTQAMVLGLLARGDGLTLGELSERLGMSKSNLSPLCKRLEAAELLRRERDGQDQRKVRMYLTDRARELAQRSCQNFVQQALEGLLGEMSERECQQVLAGLSCLLRHMQAQANTKEDLPDAGC